MHIVGEEIVKISLDILNNSRSPEALNKTCLYLMPKGKNPHSPKDFCPIIICNITMKIVTKCLANKLKPLLSNVQGILITNNGLIAMECFHWIKKKIRGKQGRMTLKLDMSKYYDRIEWDFVNTMLTTMIFPTTLTSIIMRCLTSVFYKILVNGPPFRRIVYGIGIRKGDHLSPYLFILCANVQLGFLSQEVRRDNITGIKVARTAVATCLKI